MQFWNCISTAADPTQAPDGQDSVYLYTTVAPVRPDEGWDAVRDEFADTLVKRAADFYGNLGEMEVGRRISTPADLEERTGAPSGSFLHVDFTRMGPLRPARGLAGYRTPVHGLFLGSRRLAPVRDGDRNAGTSLRAGGAAEVSGPEVPTRKKLRYM